jgi:hypothetical protein
MFCHSAKLEGRGPPIELPVTSLRSGQTAKIQRANSLQGFQHFQKSDLTCQGASQAVVLQVAVLEMS